MSCGSATEPQLSISTSAFTEFRRFNLIYADKTALIAAWARTPGLYLLTRPRRFGKSLLVTTLETLFRKGLKDFRGLVIESQWQDTTYRTVRFDFLTVKQFQTISEFQSNLHHQLALVFEPLGFHWVFELKFLAKTGGASDEKATKLLADAAEQMRSKHYGEEDRFGRCLKRLALVFSEEKRQFTAWQAV